MKKAEELPEFGTELEHVKNTTGTLLNELQLLLKTFHKQNDISD
jgi:hypothetical protein